jgi:hypothetical protein
MSAISSVLLSWRFKPCHGLSSYVNNPATCLKQGFPLHTTEGPQCILGTYPGVTLQKLYFLQ